METLPQLTQPSVEQMKVHQLARHASANLGYMAGGALAVMEGPGLAPKVAGAAMIANGVREVLWSANGNEASEGSALGRMRDRIFGYGQSLVDKNTGKANFAARLKRNVGESVLSFQDQEYRNRFSRMTGGMALFMAGAEFMNQPGMAPKIAGAVLAAAGTTELTSNSQAQHERHNEIHQGQPV